MTLQPQQTAKVKPFLVISALYLPYFLLLTLVSGHLEHLGDPSLFFSPWTDATGYKLVADYYTSLGESVRPSDYLLALRPFLFPLYLGLYKVIGIAGVQILQIVMNAASLWMVFLGSRTLSKRLWPAVGSTILLAATPSFNFIAFHAMTESLSILLVCVFIVLVIGYFKGYGKERLFWSLVVVSMLLCIKPIILPFWCMFGAYCTARYLKQGITHLWRPIVAITPVLAQVTLLFILIGSPTLSPSGSVNISEWFFPRVYQAKEYGSFIGRRTREAEEGQRRYPHLRDKVAYMLTNYEITLKIYLFLLKENLTQGSNYVKYSAQSEHRDNWAQGYLQVFSMYLNRAFASTHAIILIVMVWLTASGRRLYEEKAVLVCYLFQALLVLPAGLNYNQGDRYVLLTQPLWLIGHSAIIGLCLDLVGKHFHAKTHMGEKTAALEDV